MNEPVIIWADEPTGNLNSEAAEALMDLLAELIRARGQTLTIVTHAGGDRRAPTASCACVTAEWSRAEG